MENLKNKYQHFKDLQKLAEKVLKGKKSKWLHPFTIFSGNEENDDILDIFWGTFPYRSFIKLTDATGQVNPHPVIVRESGAILRYQRLENGFIVASIHPAKSERLKMGIDYWELGVYEDARQISESRLLDHYDILSLVMENTSIFGLPDKASRRHFLEFDWIHQYVEKGQYKRSKLKDLAIRSLYFIIPVLFSGVGLFFLQKCSTEDKQQLQITIERKMEHCKPLQLNYNIYKVDNLSNYNNDTFCYEIMKKAGISDLQIKISKRLWDGKCPTVMPLK